MKHSPGVYGLCAPNGELRYVGQSVNPSRRLKLHRNSKEKTHCGNWLRSVRASGGKVELFMIEEFSGLSGQALIDAMNESESHHIAYFKMVGCNLTNRSPGGVLRGSGYRPTEETRKKMSASHMGHASTRTPEGDEKIKLALMGKTHTEEWKAAASGRNSGAGNPQWGKKRSEEAKAKTRAALSKHERTEEHKKNILEAASRRWTPEARQRQSEIMAARRRSA